MKATAKTIVIFIYVLMMLCSVGCSESSSSRTTRQDRDSEQSSDFSDLLLLNGDYSEGLSFSNQSDTSSAGTCMLMGRGSCSDTDIVVPPIAPRRYSLETFSIFIAMSDIVRYFPNIEVQTSIIIHNCFRGKSKILKALVFQKEFHRVPNIYNLAILSQDRGFTHGHQQQIIAIQYRRRLQQPIDFTLPCPFR